MPRFHSTFGRPTLYEEVSQELEKRDVEAGNWRAEGAPIAAYKDRLVFERGICGDEDTDAEKVVHKAQVFDEHGIRIVYEEAINDMLSLEEEMVKIGSYFLNKAELANHASGSEQPLTMLDRGEVALHLLQRELELQLTKIMLVQALLEVYEHTCDPLECVRVLQIIADTMALRPRINLEATYFRDSYASEVKALTERLELYGEVIRVQRRTEQAKNEELRQF